MILENNEVVSIKQIGNNGQISLGKKYAGKQVQISELENGTLIIQLGKFIPDSESWLYTKQNLELIDKAISWTENNERRDNFEDIISAIDNE